MIIQKNLVKGPLPGEREPGNLNDSAIEGADPLRPEKEKTMAIVRWRDPLVQHAFKELNRLEDEMNTLFERFFGGRPVRRGAGTFPVVNLLQDDQNFYIAAEVPGVAAEDIDITLDEGSVVIKGERNPGEEGMGIQYHRRERVGGPFSKTISLPARVAADKVIAEVKDGILTLVLPKIGAFKPRKIRIKPE